MTDLPGDPLPIPLPANLAETLGYRSDARYVAAYHSELGDEVIVTDGRSSGTGQTWSWLMFRRHPAVAPHLEGHHLGYSDAEAEEWLVIDREQNKASVAPAEEAGAFLASQHPPAPDLTPAEEEAFRREFTRLVEEMRNRPVDWEAVVRQQREQATRLAVVLAFLDQQIPPGQGQTP